MICVSEPTKEDVPHLGLSWHGVLGWSGDLRALALRGETGSFAQRVLHRHRGGDFLSDSCHQLQGGQRSRRYILEGDEVEQVLARRRVLEGHLQGDVAMIGAEFGYKYLRRLRAKSNFGEVVPLSVREEGHLVLLCGQSRDVDEGQTSDGHGSVRPVGFQNLHQHTEPVDTDTRCPYRKNDPRRWFWGFILF